jgi:hypothetical protein
LLFFQIACRGAAIIFNTPSMTTEDQCKSNEFPDPKAFLLRTETTTAKPEVQYETILELSSGDLNWLAYRQSVWYPQIVAIEVNSNGYAETRWGQRRHPKMDNG